MKRNDCQTKRGLGRRTLKARDGLIIFALLIFAASSSRAQNKTCVGDYTIAQIAAVTIVPGTTDIGNHGDDTVTTIALPFSYTLYDQTFTSVNLSSNGNAQFTTTDTTFTNQCLPWTTHNYTIFPYWDDLYLVNSGFGIFTSISGTAPNRIFNIEWRAQYFPGSGSANFELRLYEGQTRFDVIYGTVTNGNTSATAGVQRDDTTFTQYFCNGAGGAATGGQSYIQLEVAGVDVDGNGTVGPLTDAVLILRYSFGFRGATLIAGVVGQQSRRCTAPEIETYLAACFPEFGGLPGSGHDSGQRRDVISHATSSTAVVPSLVAHRPRHHRQHDVRRPLGVVVDGLRRRPRLGRKAGLLAGVRVAIEAREVAGGDLDSHPVAGQEHVAGGDQVDAVAVHGAGLDQRWRDDRVAIPRAHRAVGEVDRRAVGRDVDELRREVGVARIGGGPQHDLDRSGDLEGLARAAPRCRPGRPFAARSRAGRRAPAARRAWRREGCRRRVGTGSRGS